MRKKFLVRRFIDEWSFTDLEIGVEEGDEVDNEVDEVIKVCWSLSHISSI